VTGVLHVVTSLERGGAQRVALEIAARLHDPGRPQLLVTGASPSALDDEAVRRLGTRLLRLPDLVRDLHPWKDAAALASLVRIIDRAADRVGSPLIVHTHTSKAGILGRLAARSVRGVVSVHTVHGFGLQALGPRRAWALEAAERIAGRAADVTVFVSEDDRRAADALGIRRGRDVVIRAGVDPAPFVAVRGDLVRREQARARWRIPADAPVVVTVGNLKPQKDPLFHAAIFEAWKARHPNAHMIFAGDGPLRKHVEEQLAILGISNAVRLIGFVDDTSEVLAAGDAFLLASRWEGLPCSVLEATAAGLPCVVKDTGWASDLSWAKNVVALPASSNADAYADALDAAVEKPPRSSKLPPSFTLAGMLKETADLYDDLVGMPRPTERFARKRRRR